MFFKIKNLGPIKDYLGIDIEHNAKGGLIKLSQTKYINKVLERFGMSNAKPVSTPLDPKIKLEPNNKQASKDDIKLFQQIIGCLLYITLGTRPDLAFSVIKLARYASNPSLEHLNALKRILRYIKGTTDLCITYYKKGSPYISGYCDADFAGDLYNAAKSTSGFIFYMANGPISWKSKLQSIIAQSTTEAEYIAINLSAKEAMFIKALLLELGFYKQNKLPIYTDNNGALLLAKNPVFHERTKHIAVKYHYIRQLIINGDIDVIFIRTNNQKADGFTKSLERLKFRLFLEHLGMAI
jgi:hypothetical protein